MNLLQDKISSQEINYKLKVSKAKYQIEMQFYCSNCRTIKLVSKLQSAKAWVVVVKLNRLHQQICLQLN